jgi:hypothetical protein
MGSPSVVKPPSPIPSAPIQTRGPVVKFKTDDVPPSQYLYLQQNDVIAFIHLSNVVNTPVFVRYRYLTPEGEIKEGVFNFNTTGGQSFIIMPFLEGWILSIGLQCGAPFPPGAFVFVQISVMRGFATASPAVSFGTIWEGYVPFAAQTGWPGTPSMHVIDGPGVLRSVTGSTPAAGAEILEVVPSNRRWTLIAFNFNLTASAAAANRSPALVLDDGVNTFLVSRTSVPQTAGQLVGYTGSPGSPFYNDTLLHILLPFPSALPIKAGFRIRTNTTSIQAGDQYSAPQYLVQEWGLWDS